MKKPFLKILFLVFSILGYSQNEISNYPNFSGQDLSTLENNIDWVILQKSSGDLNKDGLNDYALILESKDSIVEKRCSSCEWLANKPRIVLILLNQNGYEKTILQNNKFIAREDEGGMLYYLEPELKIDNGSMTIYYQYTQSSQSYTFEFKKDRFEIITAKSNHIDSASGNFQNDTYDFKKAEIITETGNISQDKINVEIIKIQIEPKLLTEFEEMYKWEVTEGRYL